MQVTLTIPDEDAQFFSELMDEFGYKIEVHSNDGFVVPEWHKKVLREREAEPPTYISMEEALKRWGVEEE